MIQKMLNRPVFATVISIIIVIGGILGLVSLPVTSYPDIAPPMVQVTAQYPGANAEVVLRSVIAPLEEKINGVEGMTYIVSTASNDGNATIKAYFELGTDPDMASVNVQNRVSAASSMLPAAVTSYGVTTEKMQNTILLMLSVYSDNPEYDQVFIENFVRINVFTELQRVKGVGRVNIFGLGDYAIRVWLDPDKMASLNLQPSDISAAIQEQNIEAAPGKFGAESETAFEYTIKYSGKFTTPEEYENIVIKAFPDGRILKLKDVARIELGAFNYSINSKALGKPSTAMAVYQMAGSNAQEVIDNILAKMEEMEKDFPKGLKWIAPYNTNNFLNASIHQVVKTLFEAFLLVFLVVFIFLKDFKSTLIPSISAIVALIGTLFCLLAFGFTINMLTLFALVLAIGIVVDDAIVVVEAVHAKLEEGEEDSFKATSSAMGEITGAIISISLVMSAVFLPVSFMSGPTGVFYRQFAITLACAVILSALNALTLSPVLCTLFIKHKPKDENEKLTFKKKFFIAFESGFTSLTNKYTKTLSLFTKKKWIPLSLFALFVAIAVILMKTTPTSFIPNEDQGILMVDLTMPPGTSLSRTTEVLNEVDRLAQEIPEIKERMTIAGTSLINNTNGGSYGLAIMSLKDWDERKGVTIEDVVAQLMVKTQSIKDGRVLCFVPPTVPGFGISSGFEMQLQDKTGGSLDRFYQVQQEFIQKLYARPEILYATTGFNINFPQYEFDINVDKCKLTGVPINSLFNTLQTYIGSAIVSDFNRFTKYYRVVVQADPEKRKSLSSINALTVKNSKGELVPISTLVTFRRVMGPESVNRYNLFTASTITGAPAAGYTTGDAINAIRETAKELPSGFGYDFSGMTKEEISSSGQQGIIFLLCFIFVFLILAAQYESYILPLSVMLSLAIGIAGVYLFINMFGIESNIYVQVAMIMLIGLLAKNGILIVEFAKQRHENGLSITEAAIEGAKARLRPILMTSFAFIFGMLPLATSSGAGAIGNRAIGIAAAGGMLIGTLFGVLIIPIMYIIFQSLDEKTRGKKSMPQAMILILALLLTTGSLSSCGVKYERPELDIENLVNGADKADTTFDVAELSWKEFYQDSLLVKLIDSALVNNLDLNSAIKRIEQSAAYFKQGKASLAPNLSAGLQGGYTKSSTLTPDSPYMSLGLNASWEIDIWGRLNSAKKAKFQDMLAQEGTKNAIQTQLIANIAKAYYQLVTLDIEKNFVLETIKNRTEYLQTIKDLKQAANVNEIAVLQAESQLLAAQAYIPDIERAIIITENSIALMLGKPSYKVERSYFANAFDIIINIENIGLPANILRNRPDVLAAEHQLQSALENFNSAKAAMYPKLTLSGNVSSDAAAFSSWFAMPASLVYGIIGGLTEPIFNGRALRTNKEVAYKQYEIAVNTFRSNVYSAGIEVSNAMYSFKADKEKTALTYKQFIALSKAYEYSYELLINGYASYLDVLTAQEGVFNARLSVLEGVKKCIDDRIEIYRSLGGGWNK